MNSKSRLSKPFIDAYWAEVEGSLVTSHKATQPAAQAAVRAFRQRFGKRGGITIYNTDPSEIADTIAQQELTQSSGRPSVSPNDPAA